MLSVKSWRTTRFMPAPSAERMANSLLRVMERAKERLATLTQAMSKTKPTAPISTSRKGRMSCTMLSFIDMVVMPESLSSTG
jgi:hypothetical protein